MARLSIKQRAKVNAALSVIYSQGYDVAAVTALALDIQGTGHDERTAYEQALNRFAADNPEMGEGLNKVTRLIEASDPATVALYDQALSSYIGTGDEAALVALAPMIAEDSIALAIQTGDLTEADIADGGIQSALGLEPSPVMAAAVAAIGQPTAISDNAVPAIGLTSDAPPTSPQSTGYRTPKAQARWESTPYTGAPPTSPGLGLTPADVREAARAAASTGSRAIIPEAPTGSLS